MDFVAKRKMLQMSVLFIALISLPYFISKKNIDDNFRIIRIAVSVYDKDLKDRTINY